MPSIKKPNQSSSTRYVWVPGEWSEPIQGLVVPWNAAVIVIDTATGARVRVAFGKKAIMEVPTKGGRTRYAAAVRGELLGIEGGFVVARLANGRTVRVRVATPARSVT